MHPMNFTVGWYPRRRYTGVSQFCGMQHAPSDTCCFVGCPKSMTHHCFPITFAPRIWCRCHHEQKEALFVDDCRCSRHWHIAFVGDKSICVLAPEGVLFPQGRGSSQSEHRTMFATAGRRQFCGFDRAQRHVQAARSSVQLVQTCIRSSTVQNKIDGIHTRSGVSYGPIVIRFNIFKFRNPAWRNARNSGCSSSGQKTTIGSEARRAA
jgi:hypothetical protein